MAKEWAAGEAVVRVTIRPGIWIGVADGSDRWMTIMRDRGAGIARTVKTLEDVEGADIDVRRVAVCGFCRSAWEESAEPDEKGMPICCDKAVAEWDAARRGEVKP